MNTSNTHSHQVSAVRHASRQTSARPISTLARLVAPLLAAIVLVGCSTLPSADSPQAGEPGMSQRRPAHWQTDGLQRAGNHGARQR
jgi:hypothetical protein